MTSPAPSRRGDAGRSARCTTACAVAGRPSLARLKPDPTATSNPRENTMTSSFVIDTAPDPSHSPANSAPIREAMKAARQHPYDVEEDGYTTGPVAAWRLLDYKAAANVAERIRDEAVAEFSDQLVEWEQFADELARFAGIADPTRATCPEIALALGNMLGRARAERANYEGAMVDLDALVDVARKAVARVKIAGGGASGVEFAIEPLERFLDSNHPAAQDPSVRIDGGEVAG